MSDLPVVIRSALFPNDWPAIRLLWEQAGEGIHLGFSDTQAEIAKKLQRDPDLFLVAEVDGQIAGAVLGGFDGRRGMVYHLAVAEPYRQLGIGRRLMSTLEDRLRARGCVKVYLLVLKNNEYAIRFYERDGWANMDNLFIYGKELV